MGRFTIRRLRLHCRIVAKATSIVHRKSLNRKYTDGKSQNKGYRQDGRCKIMLWNEKHNKDDK